MGFYNPDKPADQSPPAKPEDSLTALLRRIMRQEIDAALTDRFPPTNLHMAELTPEVEQQLADMSDEDFAALLARVRPPGNPHSRKKALRDLSRDAAGEMASALADANDKR